jgi:hypothetical protein
MFGIDTSASVSNVEGVQKHPGLRTLPSMITGPFSPVRRSRGESGATCRRRVLRLSRAEDAGLPQSAHAEASELAARCREPPPAGKLQKQFAVDAFAGKVDLNLRDCTLLVKTGALSPPPETDVRELLARLQIGHVEAKERAVDGLLDALEKEQTQSAVDALAGKVDLNLRDCNLFGVRRGVRLRGRSGSSGFGKTRASIWVDKLRIWVWV